MRSITRYRTFAALAVLVGCLGPLRSIAQVGGPTVASLTLSPSTIAGGSGGASTGNVTLSAPAPVSGTLVALSNSNSALAATRPSVTVAAGNTSTTFTVATNPLYRRYSGLDFSATISASANGSTASATLTVTAQPLPPDITGDSCQREGLVCGGSFPAGRGEAGILYECFVAPSCVGMNGTCTFRQECPLGCQSNPPDGFNFNDACATSGPFPVALNPSYIISGDRPAGTFFLADPAPAGSGGAAQSNNSNATVFPSGGVTIPAGSTSAGFDVATSFLPSIQFAAISGSIVTPQALPGGGIFFSSRLGLAWLTMVPPDPPPAQPVPTLAALSIQGGNPVTGGQRSWEIVSMSGVSPSGGPTIALSSSNPAMASVPPSVTIAAGSNNALVFIATQPVAQTTTVTLTATDGRYTFSDTLTVTP